MKEGSGMAAQTNWQQIGQEPHYGNFAITKRGGRYSVIHKPSMMSVRDGIDRKTWAVDLAERLNTLDLDTSTTEAARKNAKEELN
jgi:hypothetical protein